MEKKKDMLRAVRYAGGVGPYDTTRFFPWFIFKYIYI